MKHTVGEYVVAGAIVAGVTAGAAGAMAMTGVPTASAAVCTTSHSYAHTVTSRGTNTYTWTTKDACGHNYQKWTHRETFSYTGARSDAHTYRDENPYPHFWQQAVTDSWSKIGTHTHRVTITRG